MAHRIASINPTTGQLLREFEPHSDAEIERRLQRAADAFREYRRVPIIERARLMTRVSEILEAEKTTHARTMTLEMGKLLRAAVQEVEKCGLACRYYAQNAAAFLADDRVQRQRRTTATG